MILQITARCEIVARDVDNLAVDVGVGYAYCVLNAQGDFALVLKVVGAIVVVEEPTFVAEDVEGNVAVDVVLVEDAN